MALPSAASSLCGRNLSAQCHSWIRDTFNEYHGNTGRTCYGYRWWLPRPSRTGGARCWLAEGADGQMVAVFPDLGAVIAIQSDEEKEDSSEAIRNLVPAVIAALTSTPRPTPGPTRRPTPGPTPGPTRRPTPGPTPGPTPSPGNPTAAPVFTPTPRPTPEPTPRPTQSDTDSALDVLESTPAPSTSDNAARASIGVTALVAAAIIL